MKNKRKFIAKYLSPTNHKGARLKITDTRHCGVSKIFTWDYALGYLTEQATTKLEKIGIIIDGYSEPWTDDDKVYLFTDDFSTSLGKGGK